MPELPQPGGQQRNQQKFIVFENFEKMNTQSARQGLPEKELAWLENLQPVAPNKFMTVPAPAAAALATIGRNMVTMFYAAISGTDYLFAFGSDGSGWSIVVATGTVTQFAPAGTFSGTSAGTDVTTWEAARILINDSVAGYCTYDGTLFVQQGGVSPNITVTAGGAGYGSPPSVTISGGSGTGATATATVLAGAIVAITLTNPGTGFLAGDTLTVTIGTSAGTLATGTAVMTGKNIKDVQITSTGTYALADAGTYPLTFSGGGGTGAAGTATLTVAANPPTVTFVTSINITNTGAGYTSAPTVTIPAVTPLTGTTTLTAALGTESVASLTLTNGGSSYSAPPAVTISPTNGLGSGAMGVTTESGGVVQTLTLVPSPVVSVKLLTGGSYTAANGIYSLIFTGGGGSGAVGTATIVGGVVTSVLLISQGINYTSAPTVTVNASVTTQATFFVLIQSMGSGYTKAPNVIIGAGTSATANAHVWPFVPAGTTLAVFQGRVWLNGLNTVSNEYNILQYTGTGSTYGGVGYDDFLSADASASQVISDADLIHAITALRSLDNYLFIMGDQSVKQIGNISLNSVGDITLYTILTLSSDQGTIYPKSCISLNRVFLFANQNGIYGVFGSTVQKLSNDMDGIWELVDFTQGPQAALFDLNSIHHSVFLVRYVDPLSSERSILLAFNGTRWWVLSQGNALSAIATPASLTTGAISLYGSSGTNVTQLLAAPTTAVSFKMQSALTHHGNAVQGKKVIRAGFTANLAASGGPITMELDADGATKTYTMNVPVGFTVIGGSNDENDSPIGISGIYLGETLTGTLAGLTLTNMLIEYQETSLWKGAGGTGDFSSDFGGDFST
jgi:hypothetical protein